MKQEDIDKVVSLDEDVRRMTYFAILKLKALCGVLEKCGYTVDELAQEVFYELLRTIHRANKPDICWSTYVCNVTRYRLLNIRRSMRIQQERFPQVAEESSEALAETTSKEPDVLDQLGISDEALELQRMLTWVELTLSDQDYQLLRLRYVKRKTHEQIAKKLGVSRETVKHRFYQLQRKIKQTRLFTYY